MKQITISVLLAIAFLCLPVGVQAEKFEISSAQDLLIKGEAVCLTLF
ncbi:MAG: hypothetical protein U9R26_10485 [Campylobacterota bacterium]|nr:hypothetical protein [Campylobacterota bacterium]